VTETILMALAVLLYALGTMVYIFGLLKPSDAVSDFATWLSVAGLAPHIAAVIVRWVSVGHGPFLGFYEVVSSYALFTMVAFAAMAVFWPRIRRIGIFVVPVAFLLMGFSILSPSAGVPITARLASGWLSLHVTFAKISYSSFFVAFGLSTAYLVRERPHPERWDRFFEKLPAQDEIEAYSYRFVAAGFIALTVMIVTGAIWANEAWGRYWGWDPIETWSLASWIVYAIVLHLRLTLGWSGRKAVIASTSATIVMLFALIGVPFLYQTIHASYMIVR
jgi:cytochrome c-type biogenesis protein CcsB